MMLDLFVSPCIARYIRDLIIPPSLSLCVSCLVIFSNSVPQLSAFTRTASSRRNHVTKLELDKILHNHLLSDIDYNFRRFKPFLKTVKQCNLVASVAKLLLTIKWYVRVCPKNI